MRLLKLFLITMSATANFVATEASACTPYGYIGDKWRGLGGSGGPLGDCLEDEKDDGAGGRIQRFRSGWIDWDGKSREAFAVYGLIGEKWNKLGLAKFGHPTSDETAAPDGFGRYNYFRSNSGAVATIYFTPRSQACGRGQCEAHAVFGAILVEWARQGYERGKLGYPISDEEASTGYSSVPGERRSHFERGTISWRPDGSILDKLSSGSCQLSTGSFAEWDKHRQVWRFCD